MEIEAIDRTDEIPLQQLDDQCLFYMDLLGIQAVDLVEVSYSDLLLAQKNG